MENKNIRWITEEFQNHQKNTLWYIGFAAISIALIIYAIYSHNILTMAAFGLIIIVYFVLTHQEPQQMTYELTTTNIVVGKTNYPYRNIKKFWIIYTPQNKSLNFETTAYLNSQISIPLGKQDPLLVKQFLKTHLQEDLEKEETFTDVLSRTIKF